MRKLEAMDVLTILITIILPPLGVAIKEGLSGHFLLNLFLTFFGLYVAGLVHGLYIVLRD